MNEAQGFKRPFALQIAWYLAVGTMGFLADALAYWMFAHVFGWPTTTARLAAFVPATLATWVINRRYTFARDDAGSKSPLWQYMRYLAVQGSGIVVSFITFQSLLVKYPEHDLLSLAAGSIVALGFNYAGSRLLVFTGGADKGRDAVPLVIVGFGALSALLGQDSNWDLLNYHLYNAFALLNGRLQIDLAPAGVQSYFNPLLDLPYYVMAVSLPAPAVAFIMGAVHGVAAVLLSSVVRHALPGASAKKVWLLTLAGCFGVMFLSGIGNSMGDNTSSVLVIGAMVLCLQSLPALETRRATVAIGIAGLLVGMATGLKLTNAPFALALAAGFALCPASARDRLRAIALLTAGGVLGVLLTAGWWWAHMYAEFGNPLFPQFNSFFGSPMATPMKVIDPRWGPKSPAEALFYPFVFMRHASRVGEIGASNWLWPVAYLLVIATGALMFVRRLSRKRDTEPRRVFANDAQRFVFVFIAVSYVAWLAVFAIGRYAAVIELLLPLAVWMLLRVVWSNRFAPKLAAGLIAVAVAASVIPFKTWGHASYADRSFTPPTLPLTDPSRATIIFIAQPVAWIAVFLPPELAYVSLFNFPESPAYRARAKAIMDARGGEVWAVISAVTDTATGTAQRFNEFLARRGIASDGAVCRAIGSTLKVSSRFKGYVRANSPTCAFDPPPGPRRDIAGEERQVAANWATELRAQGLTLDESSCRRLEGRVGDQATPFQFCRISR